MAAALTLSSGYALAAVGDITEYPVPTANSYPTGIAAGPDGNLWFTESRSSMAKVARITTSGAIAEYSVPISINPKKIAAGPDGNLWFTETGYVARLTTSGAITEYPLFNIGTAVEPDGLGITAGPDGNVWFTAFDDLDPTGTGKVGKIAPSGAIAIYYISNSRYSAPEDIAAGPDGNLWFTEIDANFVVRVGRITTSGAIAEYVVPTTATCCGIGGITAGPDGNLWITEPTVNKVARVTTAGSFQEYTVPTASSRPNSITTGPDGNLWFTEGIGKVARVTPGGVFTEYPIPTANSGPGGIATGPDRNVWFTEAGQGANKVGKIVAQPSTATTNVNSVTLAGGPVTFTATFLDANNAPILGALVNYSQQSGPPGCTATFVPPSGTTDGTGTVSTTAIIPPNCPGAFVLAAIKPDPITVTATVTEEGSIVIPEAPTAILLPVTGIAATGLVLMWRRRRGARTWR